jgi:hypothetical protein
MQTAGLPCRIVVGALLAVSFLNVAMSIRRYSHPLVSDPDGWTRLESDLERARTVLGSLPERHVEYQLKEGSNGRDSGEFYRLQHILAPTILCQDGVERRYVLVEFWATRQVKQLAGLILVDDLGHGLALYRRPAR